MKANRISKGKVYYFLLLRGNNDSNGNLVIMEDFNVFVIYVNCKIIFVINLEEDFLRRSIERY